MDIRDDLLTRAIIDLYQTAIRTSWQLVNQQEKEVRSKLKYTLTRFMMTSLDESRTYVDRGLLEKLFNQASSQKITRKQ
jgi:hypothetical protein